MRQILLNDLDISASHLERLTRDLIESTLIPQNFTDAEGEEAKSHISAFQSLAGRFRTTLRVSETVFQRIFCA